MMAIRSGCRSGFFPGIIVRAPGPADEAARDPDQNPAYGPAVRVKAARMFDCLLVRIPGNRSVANGQRAAMDLIAHGKSTATQNTFCSSITS